MRVILRSASASAAIFLLPLAAVAAPGITATGARVVAETDAFRARFERGVLVSLVSKLGGGELLAPADAEAMGGLLTRAGLQPPAGDVTVSATGDQATMTRTGPHGTWTLTLCLDPDHGDLVLKATGRAAEPGVGGLRVALAPPDFDRLQLVAPMSAQGLLVRDLAPGDALDLTYCGHRNWEAQIAIFEPDPAAQAPAPDGFAVWSQDPRAIPKSLHFRRSDPGGALWLHSETLGAPDAVSSAEGVEWRINVFRGDWRVPAARYRQWMRGAFHPRLGDDWRPPAWTADISAFVKVLRNDPALLDPLARVLDPRRTLLVVVNWRRDGYDINYPDYTAAPDFPAFCARAHALGFRVMVHFNTFACSPRNPAFAALEPFVLRDRAGRPVGYEVDNPSHPKHFVHINPASSAYRKLLAGAVREAVERYGIDAAHLDQSIELVNDHAGLVEGMTMGEGKLRLMDDLLRAAPGLALGGEEFNEVTSGALSFTQRTPFDDEARSQHSIGFFLFSPACRYYSHYAFTIPAGATNSEAADVLRTQERSGLYPTFDLGYPGELSQPGAVTVAGIARAFQGHGLVPLADAPWPADARFCWRSADGRAWAVMPTDTGARLASDDEVLYERRSGLDVLDTTGSVPGWPVFDARGLSGLDPTAQYILSPDPPPDLSPRFLRLAREHTLTRWQLSDDVLWAETEVNRRAVALLRLSDLADRMRVGVLVQGTREEPLAYRAEFSRRLVASGGVRRDALSAHPPWSGVDGWGQVFAEFDLDLPLSDRGLFLDWYAGMHDSARDTDGVTYIVEVDGQRVFERHVSRQGWQPTLADLSAFAGRKVRLRLIADPGPEHRASWDLCAWGDPIIRRGCPPGPVQVLAPGEPLAATDAEGRPIPVSVKAGETPGEAGSRIVTLDLTPPGAFLLRFSPGRAVTLPFDLLAGPERIGQVSRGEWRAVPPDSDVGRRADRSCGGAVREGSVGAHPPSFGQTSFQYLVRLPRAEPLALALGYGVCGSFTKGVSFQVAVNRRTVWRDVMIEGAYREASVDLTALAGQDVLLELVTDSIGSGSYDWALWSRAVLSAG